jgi:hypothetical protein
LYDPMSTMATIKKANQHVIIHYHHHSNGLPAGTTILQVSKDYRLCKVSASV